MRLTPILLALQLLSACNCSKTRGAPAPVEDPLPDYSGGLAPAEDAVKAFFKATETGDCDTLGRLMILDKPWSKEVCDGVIEDFKRNNAHIGRIVESKIDGRDKHVVLVTTIVVYQKESGAEHTWVVRTEWRGGAWKVRF
ncbi:MAG: hypothetical protein NVSMB47_00550 [Polyangiales bacterium]